MYNFNFSYSYRLLLRILRTVLLAVAGVAMLLVSPIFAGDTPYMIGLLYEHGYGVSQDYSEAGKWFRKAAEKGNAGAQRTLAFKYIIGQGVAQNLVLADMWINIAAAQTDQPAIKIRCLIEKDMSIWQVYKGQRMAHEWMLQHPKQLKSPRQTICKDCTKLPY